MNEKIEILDIKPNDIEKRSMEIIEKELGDKVLPKENADVIKRVIHTTADFSYADNLCFSEGVVGLAIDALKSGATIVTDTTMAYSGINKTYLEKLGCEAHCFIADEDIKETAINRGITRSYASMEKAARLYDNLIIAVGNAPTALISLYEMIQRGKISPKLIIGVPVGFVNVVPSKELIMKTDVPFIVAKGRKGGSNVAAAICNSLIYTACGRKL
ncbi:MAG: precorrin-8X methylmutase [Oscillospiraceae bacterium]